MHEPKHFASLRLGAALRPMKVEYPPALDPAKVGEYPAVVKAGGGYVWDAVLEYRVWCHPHDGAEDPDGDGSDYYVLETYAEALAFSRSTKGAEEPLALVLQREYIDEPEPGRYAHVKKERLAEWPVEFLRHEAFQVQTGA